MDVRQPVSSGWRTVTRPAWWKLQISYMFWEHCAYKTHAAMLPSGSTHHHSNMPFPEEGVYPFRNEFKLCAAHSEVKGKQTKAKQRGYPESWPPHSVSLAFSCHVVGWWLLGKVACETVCVDTLYAGGITFLCSRNKFIRYRLWYVAYQLLHLTVVLLRGRDTPLVLQAVVRRSVKERIHLRHAVQTGQGLETENVTRCKAQMRARRK